MTTILSGKEIAQRLLVQVQEDVARYIERHGQAPGLAVVLVGEDPASEVYVRNKIKRAKQVGICSIEHRLPVDCSAQQLAELINQLNTDDKVHGILVQLPLPAQLNEDDVIAAIAPEKDVDGFHPVNVGALASGKAILIPCTPSGCMLMLREAVGDLTGKHAVVIGRSNIVGKPMAALLLQANCTVTIVHSRTQDIKRVCAQADILIAAVGQPELVDSTWLKPGAVVIDVGINAVQCEGKRKLVGDVNFASVAPVAQAVSPVPGGVGPMTIACLMQNTLVAANAQPNNTSKEQKLG